MKTNTVVVLLLAFLSFTNAQDDNPTGDDLINLPPIVNSPPTSKPDDNPSPSDLTNTTTTSSTSTSTFTSIPTTSIGNDSLGVKFSTMWLLFTMFML